MGALGRLHRPQAIVMAASGHGSNGFMPVRRCGLVTTVHRLPQAAGMRWRSGRLQRKRNKSSCERKQQQESGDQAMHTFLVVRTQVKPA